MNTLSFAPGSIVRFKHFAGIIVEGNLACAGTSGLPILFTSENHRVSGPASADAPAPFDWNGILVVDSLASLDLERVHIIYSTFGLDIKSPKSNIRLSESVFDENGQFDLRVGGAQIDVKDGEQFSFNQPKRIESPNVEPVLTEKPEPAPPQPRPAPAPVTIIEKKPAKKGAWKLPVRIGCGTVAVLGAGAAFFFDAKLVKNQDNYHRATDPAVKQRLLTAADPINDCHGNFPLRIESNSRLSSKTFTPGSPRRPRNRPWVCF